MTKILRLNVFSFPHLSRSVRTRDTLCFLECRAPLFLRVQTISTADGRIPGTRRIHVLFRAGKRWCREILATGYHSLHAHYWSARNDTVMPWYFIESMGSMRYKTGGWDTVSLMEGCDYVTIEKRIAHIWKKQVSLFRLPKDTEKPNIKAKR